MQKGRSKFFRVLGVGFRDLGIGGLAYTGFGFKKFGTRFVWMGLRVRASALGIRV